MNPSEHKTSARARLIRALELSGGEIRLYELISDYGFKRSLIDDLLEIGNSPIRIKLHYNGGPQPSTMVALKNYTPPKTLTQKELEARLAAMTNQEYYATLDPTYALRHKRRSGGGCRTSTGADEYPSL
jgi:hypothetical protein